jgi:histidine triad (HIT) family protein
MKGVLKMTSCIFCQVIEGAVPSAKIYEDEHVYAFMDIMPTTEGHVLLIPKKHIENIYDFTEEDAANFFKVAPKIANALKDEFRPAGLNLLQNNGAPAGQSVFHYHMHFIPRYDETDGFQLSTWETKHTTYTPDKIQELADKIRSVLA